MGGAGAGVARGAASLDIQAPAGCSLTAHYEELPLTASGHAVTGTEKGPGIENGGKQSDGSPATVSCRWIGSKAPYQVNATLKAGAGKMERSISFSAAMDPSAATPTSVVAKLPGDLNYMGDCTFTTISVDNTAHGVWGSIACDAFVPFEGQDPCALGPSYVFFENCQ